MSDNNKREWMYHWEEQDFHLGDIVSPRIHDLLKHKGSFSECLGHAICYNRGAICLLEDYYEGDTHYYKIVKQYTFKELMRIQKLREL